MRNIAPISLLCTLCFSANLHASQDKAGFSGEVSLLALIVGSDSNLSTISDDRRNANTLDSKGDMETEVIPGLLGSLSYTFGDTLEQQLFVGTSREDLAVGALALEAGYQFRFDSGTKLSFAYLPTLLKEKVWSDPFIVNANRTETDSKGNAYRVQIKQLLGSPVSIDLAYAKADIESETSGQYLGLSPAEQQTLERDSDNYYAEVSYRQFLGKGLGVTPVLSYLRADADGDSMAFDQVGAKLSYFSFASRHKIVASIDFKAANYDAQHPVFNQTREDRQTSLFVAYEYPNIFAMPALSFVSLNGFSYRDSNIDFYQEKQFLTSVGLTYHF